MDQRAEINLTELSGIISRRSTAFFGLFTVVVCAAIIVTVLMPPVYKASAKIVIQNENNLYPVGLVPVTSEDSVFLRTQKEIFLSSYILTQALRQTQAEGFLKDFDFDYLKNKVAAEYLSDSNVLEVSARLSDPKAAQAFVKSLVATFMDYQKQDKIALLNNNLDVVSTEAERLKGDIDALDAKLKDLRDKDKVGFYQAQIPYYINNILDLYKRNQLTQADVARLKEGLLKTKSAMESEQKEFFYPSVAGLSSQGTDLMPTASLASVPWVDDMKKRIAEAQSKLSQLTMKYTEDYPEVISVQNEITSLKSNLDDELVKVFKTYSEYYATTIRFLDSQTTINEAEKKRNVSELEKLSKGIDNASLAQIEFNVISKIQDTLEDVYGVFLRKQNDLELLKQQFLHSDPPNMRVFEAAALPLKPVSPLWPLNIGLGILFGIILGICASLAEENKEAAKRASGVLKKSLNSEKRGMRRVDKNILVSYEMKGHAGAEKKYTTAANISASGICMKLRDNLDVNARLPLEIRVNDNDSVHATGRVAWKEVASGDMFNTGILFDRIDSQDREKLIDSLYGKQAS